MILMAPSVKVNLGKGDKEREEFLRNAAILDVKTVSGATPSNWTDEEVKEARQFIDQHGIRWGEFSGFFGGRFLGSPDRKKHEFALQHYRQQLRHAKILGAHCVGFGWSKEFFDRPNANIWSEETWQQRIAAVAELAEAAESIGVDVAGHPLYFSPLCSIERYKEMLQTVSSPRLKVLMDIVNLTKPHMVFNTTDLVNEVFDALGEHIAAIHAKDVKISGAGLGPSPKMEKGLSLIHVDEVPPGEGVMDYATLLRRLGGLSQDVTLYVEHFSYEDTIAGQQYIRYMAREVGVALH